MVDVNVTPERVLALLAPVLDRVRRDDYWVVPHGGSPSHRTGQRLTDGALLNHVRGLHRIGACPMQRGSSTTRLALLDLDSHKGETSWPAMLKTARMLIDGAALAFGVNLIPFRSSGGRGLHLFAIWSEPQDARSVRATLADILAACGLKNGTRGIANGQAEIFPKQDSIPADGWGNMFVLPMTGESAPLDPVTLSTIELPLVEWPDSAPVTYVPPAPVPVRTADDTPELAKVRSALFAIDPNELGYGAVSGEIGWLELLFAVHAATEGSADGLALMLEWSSQWAGFDAQASAAETEKQWNAARAKPGGIGPGTLFRRAIAAGWVDPSWVPNADGFDVVPDVFEGHVSNPNQPTLLAAADGGVFLLQHIAEGKGIPGTMENIADRLRALVEDRIRYDAFLDEVQLFEDGAWRRATDEDTTRARIVLGRGGVTAPGKENVRDGLQLLARANMIDSAQQWIETLPEWDGVSRVSTFLPEYLGTEDSEYTREVSRYLLTAIVGRVMEPGCQAEMVVVLVGKQGVGKTQSVKALAPSPSCYAEIDLSRRDDDQARLLRGKIIGEIAELRGLAGRDHESIKAWLTRTHEEWTPKYRETNTLFARRCVFLGTANNDEFLADDTGNRRWLPTTVGTCRPDAVRADRDQLLAEALVIWRVSGICYAGAQRLATGVHEQYETGHLWEPLVEEWLDERQGRPFTMLEVFTGTLGPDVRTVTRAQELNMARVLRRFGCEKYRRRVDGRLRYGWEQRTVRRPVQAADIL